MIAVAGNGKRRPTAHWWCPPRSAQRWAPVKMDPLLNRAFHGKLAGRVQEWTITIQVDARSVFDRQITSIVVIRVPPASNNNLVGSNNRIDRYRVSVTDSDNIAGRRWRCNRCNPGYAIILLPTGRIAPIARVYGTVISTVAGMVSNGMGHIREIGDTCCWNRSLPADWKMEVPTILKHPNNIARPLKLVVLAPPSTCAASQLKVISAEEYTPPFWSNAQ